MKFNTFENTFAESYKEKIKIENKYIYSLKYIKEKINNLLLKNNINSIQNNLKWNEVLKKFPQYKDIHFTPELYDVFAKEYWHKKEWIYYEDESIKIFLPHLVRKVNNNKLWSNPYYDTTTVYWFWWPIVKIKNNDKYEGSLKLFVEKYLDYWKEKN